MGDKLAAVDVSQVMGDRCAQSLATSENLPGMNQWGLIKFPASSVISVGVFVLYVVPYGKLRFMLGLSDRTGGNWD